MLVPFLCVPELCFRGCFLGVLFLRGFAAGATAGNNIRAQGARDLAEVLREPSSSLEELDLWSELPPSSFLFLRLPVIWLTRRRPRTLPSLLLTVNRIGDEGAEELADALQLNSTLEELGLGCKL